MRTFLDWLRPSIINESEEVIGYHATKDIFDQFDLKFAKDALGMKMGEGLGHNKFYFSRSKDRVFPQVQGFDKRPTRLVTARLNIHKPFDGKEYLSQLRQMTINLPRSKAVDLLDSELKRSGYDCIDAGWQIAMFNSENIHIISIEDFKPKY